MTRQLLLLLVVLLGVTILWHQDYLPDSDFAVSTDLQPKSERKVVLHISQLERRHFDINGKPSSQIFTKQAQQYSDDTEHLYLDKPLFFVGSDADTQWQGSADKAKLNTDTETSLLIEHVKLNQLQSSTTIEAQSLEINNQQKIATTTDPVTIYDDHSKTTATGMLAKLQEQIIDLQNNVHTVYLPLPGHGR